MGRVYNRLSHGPCEVDGCARGATRLKKWCEMHYYRNRRTGDPTAYRQRSDRKVMGQRAVCSVEDCDRFVKGRGLCPKHYFRVLRHGSPDDKPVTHAPPEERFWRFVAKGEPDECWEWTGSIGNSGYGQFSPNGRAHRFSYTMHHGPIPDGLFVLHACDNRKCVNPAHLSAGTHQENMRQAVERGRMRNAGSKR